MANWSTNHSPRLLAGKEDFALNETLLKTVQKSLDAGGLQDYSGGVAKSLALKLGARILIGEFTDGERLPAERHLAEEFAVSRTTLRRGLDILEDSGLIARRPGSGTFISFHNQPEPAQNAGEFPVANNLETIIEADDGLTIDIAETAQMTSPLELNVVRSILEPEIARLAVINMSNKDISKMGKIIERMEMISTDATAFSRCDEELFLCLAAGVHNPLLSSLYKMVIIVRRDSSGVENRQKTLSPNRIREYKKRHQSLYKAIRTRDIESAVEFIKLHITDVQRDLMRDV